MRETDRSQIIGNTYPTKMERHFPIKPGQPKEMTPFPNSLIKEKERFCRKCAGQEKPRSDYPGQVNFALGLVKTEVWLSSGQVKLASVVLLVIISSQKQLQGLRLQDEQNNETAGINLKSKHT